MRFSMSGIDLERVFILDHSFIDPIIAGVMLCFGDKSLTFGLGAHADFQVIRGGTTDHCQQQYENHPLSHGILPRESTWWNRKTLQIKLERIAEWSSTALRTKPFDGFSETVFDGNLWRVIELASCAADVGLRIANITEPCRLIFYSGLATNDSL